MLFSLLRSANYKGKNDTQLNALLSFPAFSCDAIWSANFMSCIFSARSPDLDYCAVTMIGSSKIKSYQRTDETVVEDVRSTQILLPVTSGNQQTCRDETECCDTSGKCAPAQPHTLAISCCYFTDHQLLNKCINI